MITHDRVKQMLDYEDGKLFWKITVGARAQQGNRAGSVNNGYRYIRLDGVLYREHRIMWFWHFGYWPNIIDHVNGNGTDNRIENLRDTDWFGNIQNAAIRKDNHSGYTGVYKKGKKWAAEIQANKVRKYLGTFDCKEAAYARYITAKAELHHFQPYPR